MQNNPAISLNALRVFLLVADTGSLKGAAERLHLSPGAVSHQVRALEGALGVDLFARRNNAIELTATGATLAQEAGPGLAMAQAALEATRRGAEELTVSVSTTLATRWLIPQLDGFRRRAPKTRIRLDTLNLSGHPTGVPSDVTLAYVRADEIPDGADILFEDRCRPYAAPALVAQPDFRENPGRNFSKIPALEAAEGNWDWALWAKQAGYDAGALTYAAAFDLDDAALRAATAGMGMVLASAPIVTDDVSAGHLIPVPGLPEVVLGAYVILRGPRETGLRERFIRWLKGL